MTRPVPEAHRDLRPGAVPSPVTLWLPIILAPLVGLIDQGVGFMLMAGACSHGWWLSLHLPAIAGLVVDAWLASLVIRDWRRTGEEEPEEAGGRLGRSRIMVVLGASAVLISFAVVIAMWIPVFYLSPCVMT